ncbi:unnamed protein product [Larinioides sclopetarius]|uniref:EGF-like domain-containing protein n=1 Tax=Larinioides sclopetarius TaxID=280406 RepID=A0AAV2A9U9_9ARAC
MASRQFLKVFLVFVLFSNAKAYLNYLTDLEIRNYISQERRSTLSDNSSCHENQCAPGHCIEVLGKATCLCPEEDYRSNGGKCVAKRCSEPLLCWPGKCIVKDSRETCLCPEGFESSHGLCKKTRKKCQRSLNCSPGDCYTVNNKEVCLCPPGYFSEQGFCKETVNICSKLDCKPGRCVKEFGVEKCLCSAGYTVKDDKCVEISMHVPGKLTTVMLLVIVSAASVILTTLFGVGICYYFSQRT